MQVSPIQLSRPRRRLALGACALIALAAVAAGPPARVDASDVNALQQQIAAARGQARALAADLQAKQAALSAAAARAQSAAAREQVLAARLVAGRAREARLSRGVRRSQRRLAVVRRRLARARRVLAQRLVAIYKSDSPDLTTVVLQSDGFEDLLTRVHYWDSINRSDGRLAFRVRQDRAEVSRVLGTVRRARDRVEAHNQGLAEARAEIGAARVRAAAEAARFDQARAAQAASLAALRGRISGWAAEVARQQRIDAQRARQVVGGWLGDFAIPMSIVMCESGGNYNAVNPSSGAGGAYQITPGTWSTYGGRGRPQDASKSEQDRIATQVWARQGPGAWVCAG